jgi:hypothetical protein
LAGVVTVLLLSTLVGCDHLTPEPRPSDPASSRVATREPASVTQSPKTQGGAANMSVTVEPDIFDLLWFRMVMTPAGEVKEVPPGQARDATDKILVGEGEPTFAVHLSQAGQQRR